MSRATLRAVAEALTNAAQLFDGKRQEGVAFTEWDVEVRASISGALAALREIG